MMRSDDGSTSSDAKIVEYAERGNTVMVASETPEAIEAMWLPRGEATMMWGSTDELLARVGIALGCRLGPEGRYARPVEPIVVDKAPPPGVVRLVAGGL